MLYSSEQEFYNRLIFIKIHSLVHNQLTAEAFGPMLKYAWYKSGYCVSNPGKFKNVNEVCFDKNAILGNCVHCEDTAFIKCAHCDKILCLEDFLSKICWH